MSDYGIKLYDSSGNNLTLTPDSATVIAAGSVSMPTGLNGDNTYGANISLGGTYSEDEISVLVVPRRPNYHVTYDRYIDSGTLYFNTFYLDDSYSYYTRNDSTGVMTSFTAGNKTLNSKTTWEPVLSVFPVAFWDKRGNSSFSSINLFAATAYLIRDPGSYTNLCLAGTPSLSGEYGSDNGAASINDNNSSTAAWDGCGVMLANSCAYSWSCQVTFSSATVYRAEVRQEEYSYVPPTGNYANGHWELHLYYDSAWHEVGSGSWSGVNYVLDVTRTVYGYWRNVSGIKLVGGGSAQNHSSGQSISEHACFELRAWGNTETDSDVNKIVYSIGNQGITTVDYLICRKKYNG